MGRFGSRRRPRHRRVHHHHQKNNKKETGSNEVSRKHSSCSRKVMRRLEELSIEKLSKNMREMTSSHESEPLSYVKEKEYLGNNCYIWRVNVNCDPICAICDDGGPLLCCDGGCLRAFHPTKEDGEKSKCRTLGLTREQVKEIATFLCKNCEYKQHQCFACGALGSSDILSGAEVFHCNDISCGHFYHAKCLAGLYFPDNKIQALVFQQQIAGGRKFFCPMHKCSVCKRGEKQKNEEMHFAICRRCPTSYHRKCLPRDIVFENSEGITQRAWDNLPPGRILIFCMRHDMQIGLGTPSRDHLIFPDVVEKSKQRDVHKRKVKRLIDECITNQDIVSKKFHGEGGESSGLSKVVKSQHPTNKLPPTKGPKVAFKERYGTLNGNIAHGEKGSDGILNGRETQRGNSEGAPHQHDKKKSSEVPGINRKRRGRLMKSGHIVGAGENSSDWNAGFSSLDDIDAVDELLDCPPSEQTQTSLETVTDHNPSLRSDPMESFACRRMFPHPQPGSCGWLDA